MSHSLRVLVLTPLMIETVWAADPQDVDLVPLYALRREMKQHNAEAYFYTPEINAVADFLRGSTPSDIRSSQGIVGYAYTKQRPSTKRLRAYRDRRYAGPTRTYYTLRKIRDADLPLGVTRWEEFTELWVGSPTSKEADIPVYRLLHHNGLRERFVTNRVEFVKLRNAWNAREESDLGGSGLTFRLFSAPAEIRRPLYGIRRQIQSDDWNTFIYTTDFSEFTQTILANPAERKSLGILGYVAPESHPDSIRLNAYVDRREGSGRTRFIYSTKVIPLSLLPKGILPVPLDHPIVVLDKASDDTAPVYRVIHANGRRHMLTNDEREYLTAREEWEARDRGAFGETGISFHLFRMPY